MHYICKDAGSSWSRFIWPQISEVIPEQLWTGLWSMTEKNLAALDPFYVAIIQLYALTNNLMYENFDTTGLPQNLWGGALFSQMPQNWLRAGFYTAFDLPVLSRRIDVNEVKSRLAPFGDHPDMFLKCCTFQRYFSGCLDSTVPGTFILCNDLLTRSKSLLQAQSSSVLCLDG